MKMLDMIENSGDCLGGSRGGAYVAGGVGFLGESGFGVVVSWKLV